MMIYQQYDVDRGIVILTVECPPLPTTIHTISASALADGRVDLETEKARLTAEAEEKLRVHEVVSRMMQ